jgi:hypothetical protein
MDETSLAGIAIFGIVGTIGIWRRRLRRLREKWHPAVGRVNHQRRHHAAIDTGHLRRTVPPELVYFAPKIVR